MYHRKTKHWIGTKTQHSYVLRVVRMVLLGTMIALPWASYSAVQSHGPVAGGVTQTSADIFVRTDISASVQVQYGLSTQLTDAVNSAAITTSSTKDYTAQIRLSGLKPGTSYYYRVLVNGLGQQNSPFPTFKTFPQIEQVGEFTFAVAADVQNSLTKPQTPAPVYASIKDDGPAFLIQLGDMDHSNPIKLTAMRKMHRRLQGPETGHGIDFIANIGTQIPFFYVWDDHDMGYNNADKTFAGKADALKAYAEYFSTAKLPNPTAGVWSGFKYGQAEFFLIDARSQRDVVTDPENSQKSMLDGDNIPNGQKAWLFNGLLNSTAKWKFIMSPVPFHSKAKARDAWGAYMTERSELLSFIKANDIEGVIVISGDMHVSAIDSGANSDLPEMAVAHTNLTPTQFASGATGKWDIGMVSGLGEAGQGYGLVTVRSDSVLLEAKDRNGLTRLSYIVY